MEEFVKDFVAETVESLAALDNDLLRLETSVDDPDLVARIFRAVHTIKGTCGFLHLNRLRQVAHATENVLDAIRKGSLVATPDVVTVILRAIDQLKEIVDGLGVTGSEGDGDDRDLIAALDAIYAGTQPLASAPVTVLEEASADALDAAWSAASADIAPLDPVLEPMPAAVAAAPAAVAAAPAAAAAATGDAGAQSIRVSLSLLDTLMTSVSELVLTRNQIMQQVRNSKDSLLLGPLQRLNQVVSELQDDVMKTRMQPVGNAWSKLPRIVRDLARDLDKKIELRMTGAETELDRQVLELIRDPLTHMVRNSCDHGLESRADRLAAGKEETGVISLHAYHEGGHIVIKLSDDGRGLDLARIRAKAVERGLASTAEVAAMSDIQVGNFIFRPGFSTAAKVTDVSGRGVGMDVVRTNVERIGGTIDLVTTLGRGSVFTIKIPLTLAIVSALIVECAGQRYAVPQIAVSELVRASADGERRIEHIRDTAVLRLRERLLPLVSLQEVLRGAPVPADQAGEGNLIIVTQAGSYEFGIIVDRAHDTEEIVVKPVAPLLKEIGVYSGNTILGDGSVCMILDPNGVLARAGRVDTAAAAAASADKAGPQVAGSAAESLSLLLVRAGGGMVKAIPLDLIARLEEVNISDLHHSNGHMLLKYRDRLMPLIVADPAVALEPDSRKPVLVFSEGERSVGLIVDEIEDIVRSVVKVELEVGRPDIIGSALVNGQPTEIVNTGYFLIQAAQDWFKPPRKGAATPRDKRALVVDDSAFFRSLISPVIRTCGLEVVPAGSGEEALALLEAGEVVDLVITDIEMPGITGYELARRMKADPRWSALPVIALSSHAGPDDVARGAEAGFLRHVAKTEGNDISRAINEIMAPEYLA